MAAWSDGYFMDVPYTANFYRHMAPAAMAFACLRQGVRAPALSPGATYLELGCGQGFGLNLLAAANPAMRFIGVDFNPAHIANARRLAEAAGLSNISFDDLSFQQILDLPDGHMPRCDVIALHGVYSWVSAENRGLIVRILDRCLQPGGLVSISYNAFPAWEAVMPLRQFVKAHFDRSTGEPKARAVAAFRAAQDLIDRGARGFGGPKAPVMIKRALGSDPAYLIHEYMNDHFHPLYHADVARELEAARLTFAASASIAEDMPALAAPKTFQDLLRDEPDAVWRETLMDYANDRIFRRDIFVRGYNPIAPAELETQLDQVRFNLTASPGQVAFNFEIPIGSLTGDPTVYGAVVEALADGPRTYAELTELPAFKTAPDGSLMKVLGLLIDAGAISPADHDIGEAEAAKAFNRVLLDGFKLQDQPSHLAAPRAGAGIRVEFIDLLALSSAAHPKPGHRAQAQRGWEMLCAAGSSLTLDGKTLSGEAEHEAGLLRRFKEFDANKLPTYRRLGVI